MIYCGSFINSIGEYAIDWELEHSNDLLLRECKVDEDVVTITTLCGDVVVTGDTLIMNSKGLWVRANTLCVGDCLKHYTNNIAVATSITKRDGYKYNMMKVVDCKQSYLIVDGFYISADM